MSCRVPLAPTDCITSICERGVSNTAASAVYISVNEWLLCSRVAISAERVSLKLMTITSSFTDTLEVGVVVFSVGMISISVSLYK